MAGKLRYWKERNGRYSVRVVVPSPLRPYLDGKTEIEVQLGPDRREAIKRHAAAVAGIQHQLALAEDRHAEASNSAPSQARYALPADQLAVLQYRSLVRLDEQARLADPHFAQFDVDEADAKELRDGFSGRLSNDELDRLIGYRVERFRFKGYTNAIKGSAEWRDLAMKLCVSEYEALSRHVERNEGDFNGKPDHPLLQGVGAPDEAPTPIKTFNDIIDAEAKRRARGRGAKPFAKDTIRKYKNPAAEFAEFRKSDNAATVTADEAKRWMEAMQDEGRHGNRTIKMSMQNVRTILTWGRDHDPKGFLPAGNPLAGMTLPSYTTAPSYLRAFTLPEAVAIGVSTAIVPLGVLDLIRPYRAWSFA